ncbi:MAG TPA: YbhB/YbcL family Raf kinase inhibitor-like protein [Candidatus Binataceae bacterium]|nr:YbhB/YbcL family Raf kinase inhibitor-like protein [Candidatus Binataceae bacterium]
MRPSNLTLSALMLLLFISLDSIPTVLADALKLQITSPAISDGGRIPTQFTCDGENKSPPLTWTGVPSNAKSLALLVEDPDAPSGTFVHWVVYDISPSSTGIKPSNVEGTEGLNSAGKAAYMGPCPPRGNPHHYHFRLYALDSNLTLDGVPNARAVHAATEGHIIESADLVGIFGR